MTQQSMITRNSVVLISGGGRGITAQCTIKLAQKHPANYILLGRSSIHKPLPDWAENCPNDVELNSRIMQQITKSGKKPTPKNVSKQFKAIRNQQEIEQTLHHIRQTGSNVEYLSVDITQKALLEAQLAEPLQKHGQVTGIIHGAGVLADRRIEHKSETDFETVIAPKIDGLKNLLAIAPIESLDFLVLFSSIVSVFGNIGQTDYAIANEILNKAAYQAKRDNPQCRVISINWGPWDSGMVTTELKQAFAARHMALIPSDLGAEYLVNELTSSKDVEDDTTQILIGSIPTRPPYHYGSEIKEIQIRRLLTLESNPFLADHTIGSHPVLPATCAVAWISSTCEQVFPGYTFFQLNNFKVLKGIVFDESLAQEHVLELSDIKTDSEFEIRCSANIVSHHKNSKPLFHYTAKLVLLKELPAAPNYEVSKYLNNLKQDIIQGDTLYQDGTLFHGPSFQGVKQVLDLSEKRIILECYLPKISSKNQGQFPVQTVNPFISDAIVQSLLIWTQHFVQTPCLPSSLECLEQYQAVNFDQDYLVEMQIISHTDTTVIADLYVSDESGKLITKLTHLQGTISPLLNRFIGRKTIRKEALSND